MTETIAERAGRWDLSGATSSTGELFNQIHERVAFLQRLHFDQYIPTLGSDHVTDFETRLERWLDNLPDERDRQVLLELVPDIIFFGRDEFSKLYQAALRGPITRWVIEQSGLDFVSHDFGNRLVEEVHQHTWFCSVSDSMQISDFCHANHLGGIDYRPDLRTLSKFGDLSRILSFMQERRDAGGHWVALKRIVVLEDFIGSGTQLRDAEPAINELLDANVPILLIPLIICPDGVEAIRDMFGGKGLFRSDPILQLHGDVFINLRTNPEPDSFNWSVKNLAERCYPQVVGNDAAHPRPYTPFGCFDTGALIVLYSNTPANTLPLIQHSSDTWQPLFPRSARVK